MEARQNRWVSVFIGGVVYALMFIFAHHFGSGERPLSHGQPELLLFLLPGIVMALLHAKAPLKSTLLMGILGTLLGGALLNTALIEESSVQLLAWSLSALFWAGCGALLIRLMSILFSSRPQ